jgi:hypothetical protein
VNYYSGSALNAHDVLASNPLNTQTHLNTKREVHVTKAQVCDVFNILWENEGAQKGRMKQIKMKRERQNEEYKLTTAFIQL